MENGGGDNHKISADDVISKLKDDGGFDMLRLKIIRKLKENEELRNSITSMVKQSAALNRPGAESMKPRQLSDAIHQEIGDKLMNQISDGVWEIIRSADGMKREITESVQSVYSKLLNPKGNEEGESSSPNGVVLLGKEAGNSGSIMGSVGEIDGTLSDNEPNEPPGFSLVHQNSNREEQPKEELQLPTSNDGIPTEEQKEDPHPSQDDVDNLDLSLPPGFSAIVEPKKPCNGSDEDPDDPDLPPGFG